MHRKSHGDVNQQSSIPEVFVYMGNPIHMLMDLVCGPCPWIGSIGPGSMFCFLPSEGASIPKRALAVDCGTVVLWTDCLNKEECVWILNSVALRVNLGEPIFFLELSVWVTKNWMLQKGIYVMANFFLFYTSLNFSNWVEIFKPV